MICPSHTKSRKGCENCKRRHIRCDENFPQCRNCTKHKVRCPYNDVQAENERASTPDKPDLMWTPEIEEIITTWRTTGIFPFPGLVTTAPMPQFYTVDELRLIYHVASICDRLKTMGANHYTLWTRHVPVILAIGATDRFVMNALLAFSAANMANLTNCPSVGYLASVQRGLALKGLQASVANFSRENSDATLAASLVLSWQATDWRTWKELMQGTSSIIEAMDEWKMESQFGDFIAECITFPSAPPSPQPDRISGQAQPADLEAFTRNIAQLNKVDNYLKQAKEDPQDIHQLSSFLKGARKVSPIQSIEDQFDRLRQLRTWMLWLPVERLLKHGATYSNLLVISHYYTAAMMMERLFPEIGAAYFGSLATSPVEEITQRLYSMNFSLGDVDGDTHARTLMDFLTNTNSEFRERLGWPQPPPTTSFPQFNSVNSMSFYMSDNGTPPMSATSYQNDGCSPTFSWNASTEDLSRLASEPECGSAVSPQTISSPYCSGQYLGIPSQYGGHSPASSSFGEGSIVYSSDHEDFNWDQNFADYSPLGAGLGNFGIGFVSPTQSVWV
ncbi:hypothetical protein F4808DRAFT_216439 [Astrocystis sublimbata]|nr:hypothetical protein F4808DRAFT_216439 [Astrocystis sublimbata]